MRRKNRSFLSGRFSQPLVMQKYRSQKEEDPETQQRVRFCLSCQQHNAQHRQRYDAVGAVRFKKAVPRNRERVDVVFAKREDECLTEQRSINAAVGVG